MSKINILNAEIKDNSFTHLVENKNYIRILDTPRVWGMGFGKEIMPQAKLRQQQFERAIEEIVQRTCYRCDIASLNSPDPQWARIILAAIDTALSKETTISHKIQFRFLFGQTPACLVGEPVNFSDLKNALIHLVRKRKNKWRRQPEFWVGRFYRIREGIESLIAKKIKGLIFIDDENSETEKKSLKMTWNHAKIIAADGCEALVGGHNLNMDLFRSYPPVHDLSVVVHGNAAYSAQLFLNKMWECNGSLLTKEMLNNEKSSWSGSVTPNDLFYFKEMTDYMNKRCAEFEMIHETGGKSELHAISNPDDNSRSDCQTLIDLNERVFPKREFHTNYAALDEYKPATRILSTGKYWDENNFNNASELMKQKLIMNAKSTIYMSQMDLISAWKKNWSDHHVCRWIIDALRQNMELIVKIVVSPFDAGAGAEGDQYSFGSGAQRTFELMQYYMLHNENDDAEFTDNVMARKEALKRLFVAPFYFTHVKATEGETYYWPDLSPEGYTSTLKQKTLLENPPKKGVIGSAIKSAFNASGVLEKVSSAPGNHAKLMIIDEKCYVVGSDNLYPGWLSEFSYLIEGEEAVKSLVDNYWTHLWKYSEPHAFTGS